MCLCHKTNIKLFLLIDIIHLLCYFKNYFKAMLPPPAKRSVNLRNKHALDRCSRNDLKGNSSQLYLLNEYGDLYFLLQILDHYIVGKNQRKFKKKSCQLLFPGNHLKVKFLLALSESWPSQIPFGNVLINFHKVLVVFTRIFALIAVV